MRSKKIGVLMLSAMIFATGCSGNSNQNSNKSQATQDTTSETAQVSAVPETNGSEILGKFYEGESIDDASYIYQFNDDGTADMQIVQKYTLREDNGMKVLTHRDKDSEESLMEYTIRKENDTYKFVPVQASETLEEQAMKMEFVEGEDGVDSDKPFDGVYKLSENTTYTFTKEGIVTLNTRLSYTAATGKLVVMPLSGDSFEATQYGYEVSEDGKTLTMDDGRETKVFKKAE